MQGLSGFDKSVGFLGAGNMATALIRGLVTGGLAPSRIHATDVLAEKVGALSRELGITGQPSAEDLVRHTDIIVIAVKPGSVAEILPALAESAPGKLFVSICAGLTTQALEGFLPQSRVVRAMPNTPALVGEAATGVCGGSRSSPQDLELSEKLLGSVGLCVRVSESQMDAVTGLSGSGPAFLFVAIEALADAGVAAGLPRDVALRLAAQTVRGAGALACETGDHPGKLKDLVTSPGGTTIAGVAALERAGLRAALIDAVLAATARSKELGSR